MDFGAVQSVEELVVDARGDGDNWMERTFYYCNNITRNILFYGISQSNHENEIACAPSDKGCITW